MKDPWFPKEYARTLNYTLGAPRTFRVSRDGGTVFFLRAEAATERALDLWQAHRGDEGQTKPQESLLVRFKDLQRDGVSGIDPEAERLRKERLREAAGGITSYDIDDSGGVIAFTVGGDIYAMHTREPGPPALMSIGDATNLKVSPDGRMISYVSGRELFVAELSRSKLHAPTRVCPPATESVSWGLPEFIAAEEMHRHEGYWWSPDSRSIVFVGVDDSPIPTWYVSTPSDPAVAPRPIRYPHAGAANALLFLHIWSQGGATREIRWDKQYFPYLVAVRWRENEPAIIVQDRSQQHVEMFSVDRSTGATECTYRKNDDLWVELIPGVPEWSTTGRIVDAPDEEVRQLYVNGEAISKPGLQVRKFVGETDLGAFVYLASDDPKETHVWMSGQQGHVRLSEEDGVFDAVVGGNTVVVFGGTLGDAPLKAEIIDTARGPVSRIGLKSNSARVAISPRPRFFRSSVRDIHYSLIYPREFQYDRKLPVLFDPYGGPLAQRCVKSTLPFTTSQWFANQGFIVVVADGRGTPGRGRRWEKAIANDLIHPVLDDQVAVLDHVAGTNSHVDVSRVAIRGWSFGGYLAICSVLFRPDKFHAAVAGAPVTEWRCYDTHYTERYLGDPERNAGSYDSCSAVIAAPRLERPLLLIHGFSDDNVVCAHTFRLSQALFEAGRQHSVLPLTGITHMAASEIAAENLLLAQLSFFRNALAMDHP